LDTDVSLNGKKVITANISTAADPKIIFFLLSMITIILMQFFLLSILIDYFEESG